MYVLFFLLFTVFLKAVYTKFWRFYAFFAIFPRQKSPSAYIDTFLHVLSGSQMDDFYKDIQRQDKKFLGKSDPPPNPPPRS